MNKLDAHRKRLLKELGGASEAELAAINRLVIAKTEQVRYQATFPVCGVLVALTASFLASARPPLNITMVCIIMAAVFLAIGFYAYINLDFKTQAVTIYEEALYRVRNQPLESKNGAEDDSAGS